MALLPFSSEFVQILFANSDFAATFTFILMLGERTIVHSLGWSVRHFCGIIGINILFSRLSFSHGTFHKMTQRGENTLPEKTFAVLVDDRTVCSRKSLASELV